MKKKNILSMLIIFSAFTGIAQQIPVGSCGFVYIHDAAGNRTRRVYFCNNGSDPYPTVVNPGSGLSENMDFQPVDALYPNPTTGVFYITFSKALSNANISIIDVNGKTVQLYKATGTKLTCNLSALAAGTYFVRIEENRKTITKKVIKQ